MSSISIYIELYEDNMEEITAQSIFQFGNQIRINKTIRTSRLLEDLKQFDDKWYQYNEFKHWIPRQGLCILNEDGVNKPGPAISSLIEWNNTHGTNWNESDFVVPTPVYHACVDLQELLDPILPWINRTHILRVPPGGYFPPHRDSQKATQKTFRLIMPLANTEAPWFRFMIEDKTLNWNNGTLYAINTTLEHTLFNAYTSPDRHSLWLVINAEICWDMYAYVSSNLSIQ